MGTTAATAPIQTETNPWHACADGHAHYLLNGMTLCGAATVVLEPIEHLKARGAKSLFKNVPVDGFCPQCQRANDTRWARFGR